MKTRIALIAFGLLNASTLLFADTLVLRNGRRVEGELTAVSRREIEFEEQTGGGRRTLRIPRSDVVRIEFDDDARGGFGGFGRDNDNRDDRDRNDRDRDTGSAGVPRGMREREVSVTGREAWTDTGIDVRAGQMIYFRSSGEIRWGANRRDGAGGERNSPRNPNRPLPDRPAAALLGRVGGDVMFIGDDAGPYRARSSGRLYLGINDDVFTDNSGNLRVTVSY
jgi:hypothetical protein